jgi:ATP-dependent RNA helicase DDX46/PRP5
MARHRDSRSPSPAGSQHSSKRSKRDDDVRRDRDRRDDARLPRRRSRSRSADVCPVLLHKSSSTHTDSSRYQRRHRDRDMHRRRDRSIDRREDDFHRSSRRERSRDRRDRYVERERSPERRRRRSRDRDYRDRRDDSYDRARRRREDSTDSWPRSRGDGNLGKPPGRPESVKTAEVSLYPPSYSNIMANTFFCRQQNHLPHLHRPKQIRRPSA